MKFFKFDIESFDFDVYGSKSILETHYFNVEDIKDIIVSSSFGNAFIVKTRGGDLFHIPINDLDRLLKLVGIDEKEA